MASQEFVAENDPMQASEPDPSQAASADHQESSDPQQIVIHLDRQNAEDVMQVELQEVPEQPSVNTWATGDDLQSFVEAVAAEQEA